MNFSRKTKLSLIIGMFFIIVLFIGLYFCGFSFTRAPWNTKEPLSLISSIVDGNENQYILDNSAMRISCVKDGIIQWQINGGSYDEEGIYKVQKIASDKNDNLYVHNIVYGEHGVSVKSESVIKYDKYGNRLDTLFSLKHKEGNYPSLKGDILGLQVIDDTLYMIEKKPDSLSMYSYVENVGKKQQKVVNYKGIGQSVLEACVDGEGNVYYIAKEGGVYLLDGASRHDLYVNTQPITGDIYSVPFYMSVSDNGKMFISDVGVRQIVELDLSTKQTRAVYGNVEANLEQINATPVFDTVNVSKNGEIYITDGTSVITYNVNNGSTTTYSEVGFSTLSIFVQWSGWIIIAIISIFLLLIIFRRMYLLIVDNSTSVHKIEILTVTIIILTAAMVSMISITNSNNNLQKEFTKNIEYIGRVVSDSIDGDIIESIDSPDDILTDDYKQLKSSLNQYVSSYETVGGDLYYVIYKKIDGVIFYVAESYNAKPGIYPLGIPTPTFDNVYVDGIYESYSDDRSSEGIWSYSGSPIRNSDGEIVGLLEMGSNMYSIAKDRQVQNYNLILSVITLVVLVLFLIKEILCFAGFLEDKKYRKINNCDGTYRTVMFLIYGAYSMQASFISVLTSQMGSQVDIIPKEISGALPIAIQYLFLSITSIVVGKMYSKHNSRKMLLASIAITAAGFITTAFSPNYWVLTFGLTITGIGMGAVIVLLNTIATMIPDNERSKNIIQEINTGMLSGTQVGLLLGAYCYQYANLKGVYLSAASLSVIAIVLVILYISDTSIDSAKRLNVDTKKTSMLSFLIKRKVWGFLLLIIIPTLIADGYLSYYFPIFGNSSGLNEEKISQILMLYGIFSIYVGAKMVKPLIKRLGSKRTIILSSTIFAITLVIFAVYPGIPTMIMVSIVFGIVSGFAYSAHSIYYSELDEVRNYGEGRAVGIYTLSKGLAQAVAPMVISTLLAGGVANGTLRIAAIIVISLIVFAIVSFNSKRKRG